MGGAQENVRALAVAAKKSGHEVTVAFGETGWLAAEMNKAGVQTALLRGLRRSWNPLLALVYLRELRSLVRAQQPDIVHFHSSNAMVGLLGIRGHRGPGAQGSSDSRNRNPGTPGPRDPTTSIIATIHGLSALHPGWRGPEIIRLAYRMGLRFLLCRADKVIFVCESDLKMALEQKLVSANKAVVVHNGVSAKTDYLSREEARRKLFGVASGECRVASDYVIGTIARMDYAKNLEALIGAAAEVINKKNEGVKELKSDGVDKPTDGLDTPPSLLHSFTPSLLLVIIGGGPEEKKLRALAEKLSIADRVIFAGNVPNAARYLKAFEIFALTSRFEGLPYAVLEAAAAGLPIVTTAVGGVPEIIEDGVSGILVNVVAGLALLNEVVTESATVGVSSPRACPAPDGAGAATTQSAIANALTKLIADPALRQRLGEAAQGRVMTLFSEDSMVEGVMKTYLVARGEW